MNLLIKRISWILILVTLMVSSSLGEDPNLPDYTDYCSMLARDIAGKKHGFLAGNLMNYIGGQTNADYQVVENETIGFTHPLFDDTRSRGLGIVTNENGIGHDFGGWEFYRQERVAYGTVIIDGEKYRHPVPDEMIWRPDRQICRYKIKNTVIEETKFITRNDVLVTMITSDRPVTLLFEGQSFFMEGETPFYYLNPKGTPFMKKSTATAVYDREANAIQVVEGGTVITRIDHNEKGTPAIEGKFVYEGMSKVIASSQGMDQSVSFQQKENGQQLYQFSVPCDPKGVTLVFAMDDDYKSALNRCREILADPGSALQAKTDFMNDLLNYQIPYFRCSDDPAVKTYYYLWSLYFMYFRDVRKGYTPYPYTVTAINNFRTLFCFDAVSYIAMASWVVDKEQWGYGNCLNFKSMLPYLKDGNIPETFGTTWWSPVYASPLEFHVELAWQIYSHTADLDFIKEIYPFYKAVFEQRVQNKDGETWYRNINAMQALHQMANALGFTNDAEYWLMKKKKMVEALDGEWEVDTPDYFGSGKVKDVWNLAAFYCRDLPDAWVKAMTKNWVMNAEKGFFGEVPLKIRAFDSEQIPPFNVNSINTYLAVEGMFRHHVDADAITCTLGHITGMVKDYGFPVAPECWDENDKPWGSAYYAWDEPIILPFIERLAGIDFSLVDHSLKVEEHLPPTWDFIDVRIPVVENKKTSWFGVQINRKKENKQVTKTIRVKGNDQARLTISPWMEGKELLQAIPAQYIPDQVPGHISYEFKNLSDIEIKVTLKENR